MPLTIFVDESGDLGWKFDQPYREGGSSRHLTIGSVCIPPGKEYLTRRVVRDLYDKFRWNTKKEKKWVDMSDVARTEFVRAARQLAEAHNDIHFHAITVKKENVQPHIRSDSNKLYNYMVRLSLLDRMALHASVTLVPDPRSIRVESGNSLSDYLQIEMWFTKKAQTAIYTKTRHSHQCEELQFADYLSGVVQSFHEDGERTNFAVLSSRIKQGRLYFR
jgi:hypothetical protein